MTLTVSISELPGCVGRSLGPTDWLSIEQDRIDQFAQATEDHQWIHVDPVQAADGPFGTTIAHGYLTLALVNKFLPELITVTESSMGVNYGCEKVRFPSPVKVNSNLRGVGEILAVLPVGEGQQVTIRVTVEIEGEDRPACVVDTVSRFYP